MEEEPCGVEGCVVGGTWVQQGAETCPDQFILEVSAFSWVHMPNRQLGREVISGESNMTLTT